MFRHRRNSSNVSQENLLEASALVRNEGVNYPSEHPVPRKTFAANMFVVVLSIFVLESARGLFIASLWPTVEIVGGDRAFMGYVVGVFSFGRLVMTTPMGKWADSRKEKEPLLFSSVVTIIANLLYVVAYLMKDAYVLIASRFLVGIGGGTLSVCRSHISKITTTEERATYVALIGAAQFAGFGITPFLSMWFTVLPEKSFLNMETAPALMHCVMNFVVMICILFIFDTEAAVYNHTKKCTSRNGNKCNFRCNYSTITDQPSENEGNYGTVKKNSSSSEKELLLEQEWEKLVWYGIVLFMFLNFSSRGVMSVVETIGTPKYIEINHIHGTEEKVVASSIFFGKLGLIGMLVFGVTVLLQKCGAQEQIMLACAFIVMVGGSGLIGWSETLPEAPENHATLILLFYGGCLLIWSLSFPIKQTTLVSSFSKILGARPQGTMMGWIGTFGSIGRIAGLAFSKKEGVTFSSLRNLNDYGKSVK
eukprot:Nk52_evm92s1810 gene=Nk52_evmTU92s1810